MRRVPPSGIASREFTARFSSAISSWFGSPNLADAFIMAFAPFKPPMVISEKVLDELRWQMLRSRF
jgi:hypothetical protein